MQAVSAFEVVVVVVIVLLVVEDLAPKGAAWRSSCLPHNLILRGSFGVVVGVARTALTVPP